MSTLTESISAIETTIRKFSTGLLVLFIVSVCSCSDDGGVVSTEASGTEANDTVSEFEASVVNHGAESINPDADDANSAVASELKSPAQNQAVKSQVLSRLDPFIRKTSSGNSLGFLTAKGAHAWLGLRFAQSPVGDLRWRAPIAFGQADDRGEAVISADTFGSPCVQLPVNIPGSGIDPDAPYGNEDCLFLNVYTPPMSTTAVASAQLPVMFWIHGGGNAIGEASQFDGSQLAVEQNVVVVTINYRLGPFGWFRHPELTGDGGSAADRSGNFGTLDQLMALQWTRDNIAQFGGNASNVTVFGESAGGRNVVGLLLSPLAKGLFHRAIVQSGSSSFPDVLQADSLHPGSGQRVVKRASAADGLFKAGQLRALDAHKMLSYFAAKGESGLPLLDMPNLFRDGYVLPLNAGVDAFTAGQYNKVPIILGTNRDEQKLFMYLNPNNSSKWLGFWQRLTDAEKYDRDAYYFSTRWRIAGAEIIARAIDEPVYVYRFDWDELASPLGMDFPRMIGAGHGLEMGFVFGSLDMGPFDQLLNTEENQPGREQLTQAIMNYWGNFARTGNPNLGKSVPTLWREWGHQETYIQFDTEADAGIKMRTDTMTFHALMEQLKTDARFETSAERCGLFLELLQWSPELLAWKSHIGC